MVLSRLRDRVSLCINSFSTPKGGLTARLVDVGDGSQPADYENLDVKGAVVLGDADAGRLWQHAVKARGAVGVISTEHRPVHPAVRSEALHLARPARSLSVGLDPLRRRRQRLRLQGELARRLAPARAPARTGRCKSKIDIESTFYDAPNRTLVAEIPGTVKPDERIVMAAHIQEPGANDDASGCGTLLALAAALAERRRRPRPCSRPAAR